MEIKRKDAALRLRTQEDIDKELATLRRDIDMKDIEIKLHD